MTTLIQFVGIYAPYIYAVCGIVALYQIYRTWQVRGERRQAVFSLEREKAVRELYSIFSSALLLLVIMGITYFVSNTLAAASGEQANALPTPTPTLGPVIPGALVTPTYTPLPATETPPPTNTAPPVAPTAAPTTLAEAPTPAATPVPVVQQQQTAGCSDGAGHAIIQSPGNSQSVQGAINIFGTATHESFQFYKVEVSPAGSENWSYLDGGSASVVGGLLASVDTGVLVNGTYTLRLAVVDNTGNFASCQVTIQVQN
jgi:hypothetical protein